MAHNKGRKYPAEVLSAQEIKQLMAACAKRSSASVRGRGLIAFLYRTGAPISEALAIMPKDLDLQNGSVRILFGKGQRSRLVGLDAGVLALMELWLERRSKLGITNRSPIFCTFKGTPMKTSYIRNWLRRLAKKAGIERRVHAHALRHTFASECANEGTPLHLLQQQLGHKWLATTDAYVRHICPTTVVQAMRSREWTL